MLAEDYPPINVAYPARFRDAQGESATSIENDGTMLRMTLRGMKFYSDSFEEWELEEGDQFTNENAQKQAVFAWHPNFKAMLWDFTLECELPLPLVFAQKNLQWMLQVRLNCGSIPTDETVGQPGLHLTLLAGDKTFTDPGAASSSETGYFDSALEAISRLLPADMDLRVCACCTFGVYPLGAGAKFGNFHCLKRARQACLALRQETESDWLFRRVCWKLPWVNVQEIYSCPEFARHAPKYSQRK